jgi:hypothetical protein
LLANAKQSFGDFAIPEVYKKWQAWTAADDSAEYRNQRLKSAPLQRSLCAERGYGVQAITTRVAQSATN